MADFAGIFGDRPVEISYEEQGFWNRLNKSKYPFYVIMTDSFLSNWGRSGSRSALFVYGARSLEEAKVVSTNARNRGDQQNIRILSRKPNVEPTEYRLEFVEPGQKGKRNWYTPGWIFQK